MRLTTSQSLVRYLQSQHCVRDGSANPFFAGIFGIFGHGNIAGIGQALQAQPGFRLYHARNEQSMVHAATAFAKVKNRLQTLACTSSIGPGATNMITGAAAATINRLPVLLIPGDSFARRDVAPVLQQLESAHSQDISVNDAFKPVSAYWDRINRPDQLLSALPEVMRVLTDPAQTGAVTLCLPQDVATEAHDYPDAFFARRDWVVPRARPDAALLLAAAKRIRASKRPMIVAGGGMIYSEACAMLDKFVRATGIPSAETMAGKGSLRFDRALNLGAIGATGTFAANEIAAEADLVIGIGTRYSDFTTASKSAWQDAGVQFININVSAFDAAKHSGLMLTGDARATLEELLALLQGWRAPAAHTARARKLHAAWEQHVDAQYAQRGDPLPTQAELIGAVNEGSDPDAIMVCAAGSLPGDLHKLWRARSDKNYHLEYGYSTMGYEIAGGLGSKLASPDREVIVMVGDGSYLMMSQEIVTSVQEGLPLIIVLLDNDGYKSIGGLSRSLGQQGFGTRYAFPVEEERGGITDKRGEITDKRGGISDKREEITDKRLQKRGEGRRLASDLDVAATRLPVDLAANAESLGARVIRCTTLAEFEAGLAVARQADRTTVVYIKNDRLAGVPGHGWWDVPPAEVSDSAGVQAARAQWEMDRKKQRRY